MAYSNLCLLLCPLPSLNCLNNSDLIECFNRLFLKFSTAEIGDFDENIDREHLAKNKYIPQQEALEDKIMEFHRNHM